MKSRCWVSLCLLAASTLVIAQNSATIAPAPPLGWNSWDAYGLTITESQFKANVDWFHQHLQPYGWHYVVIDEGWYLARPENSKDPGYTLSSGGFYQPAVNRFPSAAPQQGFTPLADYVHSLGLKFGIHIIEGIPREAVEKNLAIGSTVYRAAEAVDRSDVCRWNSDNYGAKNNAAGQAYYDSLIQLYAAWGVDYLKVDCISSPYKADSIRMISNAIKKSGRPIVLSLSPGPTPLEDATNVSQHAQLWRISNDFWDVWTSPHDESGFPQNLKGQFGLLADWAPYAGPGQWPDADMLPIGYLGPHAGWGPSPRQSRLTADETRTLITLWSIARSPLIIGANLTRMDEATEALLTNPEVLAVDQRTTGNRPIAEASRNGNIVMWTALEGTDHVLAIFNRGDHPAKVVIASWDKLGDQAGLDKSRYHIRDLWQRKNLGLQSSLQVSLPPHGAGLYRLIP